MAADGSAGSAAVNASRNAKYRRVQEAETQTTQIHPQSGVQSVRRRRQRPRPLRIHCLLQLQSVLQVHIIKSVFLIIFVLFSPTFAGEVYTPTRPTSVRR